MIVAANWKMNMGLNSATKFLLRFKNLTKKEEDIKNFIFFPPASLSFLFQREAFFWGGQNIYHKTKGAFTGESSGKTLKEMGASFCLLGHSERRYIFGESNTEIEKKFQILQELALIPVLCIGENLKARFDKKKPLKNQLSWLKNPKKYKNLPWKTKALPKVFKKTPLIIAYEPIWSIGTGDSPSSQETEETAQFIKEYLALPSLKVFYGGSLDKKSVKKFLKCSFIDGFLLGGASLNPNHFYDIYQQVKSISSV